MYTWTPLWLLGPVAGIHIYKTWTVNRYRTGELRFVCVKSTIMFTFLSRVLWVVVFKGLWCMWSKIYTYCYILYMIYTQYISLVLIIQKKVLLPYLLYAKAFPIRTVGWRTIQKTIWRLCIIVYASTHVTTWGSVCVHGPQPMTHTQL